MNERGASVLVVEDNDGHVELIHRAFRRRDIPVRLAVSASISQARAAIHEAAPDLVLADLKLPDGTGTELLSDATPPPFPLIIMTGQGDEKAAVEVMKSGAMDYVVKSAAALDSMPYVVEKALQHWEDLLARKRAEAKLRELESQVAHASRITTVGEMVAGIVHELGQPLCSIANFAKASRNVLASSPEPDLDQLRDWNGDIVSATERAAAIIGRLRSFMRRTEPRAAPAGLNEVIRESVTILQGEVQRLNVDVGLELVDPSPVVDVDRIQIQQVLLNLMHNAMEAMEGAERAQPRMDVRSEVVDGLANVSISDNGPGLPEDESFDIFEPFSTTKPNGMGMGLAISQGIMDAHNGRLWATPNTSVGATFRIALPVIGMDGD